METLEKVPYELSQVQRLAVGASAKEICVTAQAGSGKTRVLVEKFLHWVLEKNVPADRIVAITFTKKAADEMKERLRKQFRQRRNVRGASLLERGNITTIHAFCLKLLKENPIDAGLDPSFGVLEEDFAALMKRDSTEEALDQALRDAPEAFLGLFEYASLEQVKESLLSVYERSRNRMGRLTIQPTNQHNQIFLDLLLRFHEVYENKKRERSLVDFNDQIWLCLKMLENPVLLNRLQSHFDLLMVDEFQDVNGLQFEFISRLGQTIPVFFVGDPRQSIYGFRHADSSLFVNKIISLKEPTGQVISMPENYRSRPHLIDFVNRLFGDREASEGFHFGQLVTQRSSRIDPVPQVEVRVISKQPETQLTMEDLRRHETHNLAEYIKSLVEDGSFLIRTKEGQERPLEYGDIAILLRQRTALHLYEEALKTLEIPHHVSQGRGFYEKSEITDLLNVLRLITRPKDTLIRAAVLKSPFVGLSDDSLYKLFSKNVPGEALPDPDRKWLVEFEAWFEELSQLRSKLTLSQLIHEILKRTQFEAVLLGMPDAERRFWNVRKFKDKARRFEGALGSNLEAFLEHAENIMKMEGLDEGEAPVVSEENAVTIMTVHSAKGLEFPVVCLADLGTSPEASRHRGVFMMTDHMEILSCQTSSEGSSRVKDEGWDQAVKEMEAKERQENLRLFYVACTRATEHLICSGIRREKSRKSLTKPWIEEILSVDWNEFPIQIHEDVVSEERKKTGSLPESKFTLEENLRWMKYDSFEAPETVAVVMERFQSKQKPYFQTLNLTVSALAQYRAGGSPKNFKEEKNSPDEGGILSASSFGTLFHEILQHVDYTKPQEREVENLMRKYRHAMDLESEKAIRKALEIFFKNSLVEELQASARSRNPLHRELPFQYRMKMKDRDLGYLKGQVDLLFANRQKEWIMVDYKTGSISPEHEDQIRMYAFCLKRLIGGKPDRAYLYYSKEGLFKEVSLEEVLREHFEATLTQDYHSLCEIMLQ